MLYDIRIGRRAQGDGSAGKVHGMQARGPGPDPRTQVKNKKQELGGGSTGVAEAGGFWGALASQPSQSVNVRPVSKQVVRQPGTAPEIVLWPLHIGVYAHPHIHTCKHMRTHVHTYTCMHTYKHELKERPRAEILSFVPEPTFLTTQKPLVLLHWTQFSHWQMDAGMLTMPP